ncbi:hypothetical protein AGMMS49992_29250 [Clostridia bacterium]|nr:hypothetical protein AGMMS49992_29250 [Clostridia bacterium]
MIKPTDWDQTAAYTGAFDRLPPGYYVCKIVGARMEVSRSGREQFVLALDVSEGEHKGFFKSQYDSRKASGGGFSDQTKWPCTFYQGIKANDGRTNGFFKGLISTIEESNPGYTFNWDERTLKDKAVGFVFGEEEFMGNDGNVRTNVKPARFTSVEKARVGGSAPELRKLANTPPQVLVGSAYYGSGGGSTMPANEDDLPF